MIHPNPTSAPLKLHLFGPFQAWVRGEPLPRLRSRKGHWLLALLALRHGRRVERGWLLSLLWPENPERLAAHSLRNSLTDLRHALGPEVGRLLSPTPRTLSLDLSGAFADVVAFDAAIADGSPAALAMAVSLYRGPLLEGCAEEWAFQERQQREQAFLSALQRLASCAAEARDFATAECHLRRLVAADPLREESWRALMQVLAGGGNVAGMAAAYAELRHLLRRETDLDPDPETRALFERLSATGRRQSAAPALSAPLPEPYLSPREPKHNLPYPLTRFVGRTRQMEEIDRLMAGRRLVTLTGAGGCGKSRLALEVAHRRAVEVPHGAWLVELAALADPDRIPASVAAVLAIREEAGQPLLETLTRALRQRELLLVIDNCEHLIDGCARFVEALLQSCPRLSVLATSREPLDIAGEQLFRVPSLSLPEWSSELAVSSNGVPTRIGTGDDGPEESEAVSLFVDRASMALPAFRVCPETAPHVASICCRLDGIPLAIELAAARLKLLSVEEIAARLDDPFHLLSVGSRTAPSRHQTLQAAVDWSYRLLSNKEQALLQRLSVFAGGFTVAAAEAVCANAVDSGQGAAASEEAPPSLSTVDCRLSPDHVLDLLTALAEKSLLVVEDHRGQPRHRLLETMRDYGRRRLTSAEAARLSSLHAAYYLALAEQSEEALRGAEWTVWLERLDLEIHNLRAALDWYASEDRSGEAELRLTGALRPYWIYRGHLREGQARLERSLARAEADRSPAAYASALFGLASMADHLCDYATARGHLERALALWQGLGDRKGMAWCLSGLAINANVDGDHERARALFAESLRLRRAVGDRRGEADNLHMLAILELERGATSAARILLDESLAIHRELGGGHGLSYLLNTLGTTAMAQGDYARARALLEEAVELDREAGHKEGIAFSLRNLARVAIDECRFTAAQSLLEEALALTRELGGRSGEAHTLLFLGYAAEQLGDAAQGRRLYEEALAIQRALGYRAAIAQSCLFLGRYTLLHGDIREARAVLEEGLIEARHVRDPRRIAPLLVTLGEVETRRGDLPAARAQLEEALRLYEQSENRRGLSSALQGFAVLARAEAAPERAARLWGAAEAARQAAGILAPPTERAEADREIALLRETLGEKAYAAARSAGVAMGLEAALRHATGCSGRMKDRPRGASRLRRRYVRNQH